MLTVVTATRLRSINTDCSPRTGKVPVREPDGGKTLDVIVAKLLQITRNVVLTDHKINMQQAGKVAVGTEFRAINEQASHIISLSAILTSGKDQGSDLT